MRGSISKSALVRVLALLLSLAVMAAACGGSDDDDGGDGADDDATPTTAVNDGGGDAPATTIEALTSEGEGAAAEDEAATDPQFGGEIDWALTNDGTGYDTTSAIAPGSLRVLTAMADGLVAITPDFGWTPLLAESLTPNDDFTTWTIGLRPDVQFHDGQVLDATAMAANFDGMRVGSAMSFVFAAISEVVVIDDLTVEIRMNTPWSSFPYTLIGQGGWMVAPDTVGQNDTFVGTGPYMLEEWVPGDRARVVANPNYWRTDVGPYLDAINFKFVPDSTARRQAFDAGDVIGYLSPQDFDILEFLDDDNADVWIGEAGANEYLYLFNNNVAPTDDVRVRRALAHAVDRDLLIETFRSGLTEKASSSLAPSSPFWAETDYPDYDPETAAALIAEYEAEVGPVQFSIKLEPNPSVREVVEFVVSFWEDAGAEVEIVEIGQGLSASTAIADDFQAFSWFQFGGPDADTLYHFFHSLGGANILNWTNHAIADIDEALDIGRSSDDPAVRAEGYTQFQEALAEHVPMMWIDHLAGVEAVVSRPEIRGLGARGEFDGQEVFLMTNGSFFSWAGVWMAQG